MGLSGYNKAVNSMIEMVNRLILGKNKLIKYCTKLIPGQPVINGKSHPPQIYYLKLCKAIEAA